MPFVPLYVDCALRGGWTQMFAGSATDATFGVNGGDFEGVLIVRIEWNQFDCIRRAMPLAAVAAHFVPHDNAEVVLPYGVPDLNRGFLLFRDWADCPERACLGTLGTLNPAVPFFERHFRLPQPTRGTGRPKYPVRAAGGAEPTSGAMRPKVNRGLGSWGENRGLPHRSDFWNKGGQATVNLHLGTGFLRGHEESCHHELTTRRGFRSVRTGL